MENPNQVVPPDYSTDDFVAEREPFINAGLTEQQASDALRNLWTIRNNRDKAIWQRRQEEAAEADEAERDRQELLRQQQEDEDAQVLREERKKNKAKFAPIPNRPVTSELLVLPSLVAVRKLKNHQFCELWYFINAGPDEAERSVAFAIDDNSLSIVPAADGSHSFVPSAFARDKSDVVHDESLTFEQFGQATVRMIAAMANNGWQKPHVDMHIQFWSNIEHHKWRYSRMDSHQRALLTYQGNQRRNWHATIGGPQAFNLALINEDILNDTLNKIVLRINNEHHRLIRTCFHAPIRPLFNAAHRTLTFFSASTGLTHTPDKNRVHWNYPHAYCTTRASLVPTTRRIPARHWYSPHAAFSHVTGIRHTSSPRTSLGRPHAAPSPIPRGRSLESALDRLSQANDKSAGSAAAPSSSFTPSHMRSSSGQKRPASPPCASSSYIPKKMHSFRTNNQAQLNDLVAFILSVCPVCLGRHKHDILRCASPRTWDDKHDALTERIGAGLFTKAGKQLCARWQKPSGCMEAHRLLHFCSGCGAKTHGAQRCPRAQDLLPSDSVQG
jgi:hypothetical protein